MLNYSLFVIIFVSTIHGNDEACPWGKYGETCEETCSPNCAPFSTAKSVHCHKLTGKCSEGCKSGWHGDRCNRKCSKNCLNGVCDVYDGTCTACRENYSGDHCETLRNGEKCPLGKHGVTCDETCNPNCAPFSTNKSVHCHKQTGRCSEGCIDGWHGERCDNRCSRNCLNRICAVHGGACTECEVNYSGDYCETHKETQKSTLPFAIFVPIINIHIIIIIVIIIVIIIGVTVYRRRRRGRKRSNWQPDDNESSGMLNLDKANSDLQTPDTDLQTPDTDLIVACREGNLQRVRDFLDQSLADINKKGCGGMTPVMWAARMGHREVLDLLVRQTADLKLVDGFGNNLLHWACHGGHVAMVKHIIQKKMVNINNRVQDGRTPVMCAARAGEKQMFELLVSEGDLPLGVDNDGNNILLLACFGGNVKIVEYIISHHAHDINCTGESGRTPLMAAAYKGHEHIFDLLVEKGADLTPVDDAGDNILHVACLGGHVDIVSRVLKLDNVDINSRGQCSRTPLMMAARRGEHDVFSLLVNKEADASPVDDDGNNILHLACKGGQLEIVRFILKNMMTDIVDINVRNKRNETATMRATNGSELCNLLVSLGGCTR